MQFSSINKTVQYKLGSCFRATDALLNELFFVVTQGSQTPVYFERIFRINLEALQIKQGKLLQGTIFRWVTFNPTCYLAIFSAYNNKTSMFNLYCRWQFKINMNKGKSITKQSHWSWAILSYLAIPAKFSIHNWETIFK